MNQTTPAAHAAARLRSTSMARSSVLALALAAAALVFPALPAGAAPEDQNPSAAWTPVNGLVLRGTILTQDAEHRVIEDGAVCVMGERIVAVLAAGEKLPAGFEAAAVIETGGVILPGLINAHNHIAYNYLELWEAPRLYSNRYEWTSPKSYKLDINYPKKLVTEPAYFGLQIEAVKYAEVKELVGGTTAVQGAPPASSGFGRMLARNIDLGLDRDDIYQHGLSITDGRFQEEVRAGGGILGNMNKGKVAAWLIHLAEGVDEASRREFDVLVELGLLREETVVIHGTALGEREFAAMAAVGADLVWSPLSNRLLYGKTTDVRTARRAGVNVSIASDWSPSGSKNVLGELKIADEIDNNEWGNVLSYRDIVDMATVNPARALKWDDRLGRIQAGFYADILVVDRRTADPYESVVRATERNVSLVLVGGDPLYGEVGAMSLLKGADVEEVYGSGERPKVIDVTKPGETKGTQTLATIVESLARALRFDPEQMRTTFRDTQAMTPAQFATWLAQKFPGLRAVALDPIFAEEDDRFFAMIAASANAGFPYDLRRYWDTADVPAAVIEAGAAEVEEGAPASFSGVRSLGGSAPVTTYEWSFGDGAIASGPVASHTYGDDGAYEVTLRTTDAAGRTAIATATALVKNAPPVAAAGGPYAAVVGVPAALAGSATDPSAADAASLSYTWTFPDGVTLEGAAVERIFLSPGTVTAVLTVRDADGGSSTSEALVTVEAPPRTLVPLVESIALDGVTYGSGSPEVAALNAAGESGVRLYVGGACEARFGALDPVYAVDSATVTIGYRMTSRTWAGTLRAELRSGDDVLGVLSLPMTTRSASVAWDVTALVPPEKAGSLAVRLVNEEPRGLKTIWSFAALELRVR